MATTQEQVDILKQQIAQLATKSQWQQLVDLLSDYKTTTDSLLSGYLARIEALESENHNLKARVYALENP